MKKYAALVDTICESYEGDAFEASAQDVAAVMEDMEERWSTFSCITLHIGGSITLIPVAAIVAFSIVEVPE